MIPVNKKYPPVIPTRRHPSPPAAGSPPRSARRRLRRLYQLPYFGMIWEEGEGPRHLWWLSSLTPQPDLGGSKGRGGKSPPLLPSALLVGFGREGRGAASTATAGSSSVRRRQPAPLLRLNLGGREGPPPPLLLAPPSFAAAADSPHLARSRREGRGKRRQLQWPPPPPSAPPAGRGEQVRREEGKGEGVKGEVGGYGWRSEDLVGEG
jgi:hypothetical protein